MIDVKKIQKSIKNDFLKKGIIGLMMILLGSVSFNSEAQNCKADFEFYVNGANVTVTDSPASARTADHQWKMGDGSSYIKPTFSHTYQQNGEYDLCHYVSDTSGSNCTDTVCKKVFIYTPCDPKFTFSKSGKTVQFQDQSKMSDSLYHASWKFGDGNSSKKQSPQHTYQKNGNYKVCLSVMDTAGVGIGCQKEYCLTVTVGGGGNNNCKAGFSYVDSGKTVSFTDQSSNFSGSKQYDWFFGDGGYSSNANPTHVYSQRGKYLVCQIVEGNQCKDTLCDTVLVKKPSPSCNAKFTYSKHNNITYNFKNKSTGDSLNYYWQFGDGITSKKANPTHQYDTLGNFTVTLFIASQNNQCVDTFTKFLRVNTGNVIAGYIYKDSGFYSDAEVGLYRYDSSNAIYKLERTQDTDSAIYYMSNLIPGKYMVKAVPDTNSSYITTYQDSAITWPNAQKIVMQGFNNGKYNKHIWMQKQTNNNNQGNGQLSGIIQSSGPNKRQGDEKPITGAQILLLDESGESVAMTYSDEKGHYQFENLGVGEYAIQVELTNYTSEKAEASLKRSNETLQGIDFEVKKDQKEIVVQRTTLMEGSAQTMENLKVYPNPAEDKIQIAVQGAQKGTFNVNLVNMKGQLVKTDEYSQGQDNSPISFKVDNLKSGIYLLKIQNSVSGIQGSKLIRIK